MTLRTRGKSAKLGVKPCRDSPSFPNKISICLRQPKGGEFGSAGFVHARIYSIPPIGTGSEGH